MKKVLIVLTICAIPLISCGCASQGQVVAADPLCLQDANELTLMEAAHDVLRGMQFRIEKYDTQAGYIRTSPLAGGQFIEPWSQDNASGFAAAQSNLQSIQRTVEVEVYPSGDTACVRCAVEVRRLSLPEKPIAGMAMMPGSLTDSNAIQQELTPSKGRMEQMEWIEAGNDRALENKILKKIKNKIKKG